jgi:long-subunit fatty acid transport protein
VTTYGIAGAYRLFDTLSIGGSIGFSELDLSNILITNYWVESWAASDWAENYTVGLFWNPFGGLNIGAVYRYGPRFSYVTQVFSNFRTDFSNNELIQFNDVYKIPDVYGIGISYRFPFGLTIAADYDYIKYSQTDDNLYNLRGEDQTIPQSLYLYLDDAYEIHAGLEWAFTVRDTPLAVRTGYAFKKAHTLATNSSSISSQYFYQEGDDENIFSAGFGVVLFKNLQLDFSGAWGNLSTEYIASAVIRF